MLRKVTSRFAAARQQLGAESQKLGFPCFGSAAASAYDPAAMDSPPIQPPHGRRSLAASAKGADRMIGPLLLLALAALVASWLLPFMTVERFIWLSEEITVWRGVGELWTSGAYGLFLIVAVFCVLFPLLKLALAVYLWFLADLSALRGTRLLQLLDSLGKWSMLDVFVVALSVVALNISLISDVQVHGGIYVFTAAVILSMVLVRRILALAARQES